MKINWLGAIDEDKGVDWVVGDSFYDDDYPRELISANHAGKRPIIVCLPGRVFFCVYSKQRRDGKEFEPGWTVTGDPENLTLSPSVNLEGIWHGFISNGSFTPDPTPAQIAEEKAWEEHYHQTMGAEASPAPEAKP